VLADDPRLTARFPDARQPLKIVLDREGRTPATAKVREGPAELLIDPGSDLPGLLDRLGERQILSLLVEGGARVHGSFFDLGLVDRVFAYLSASVVGGAEALGAVAGRGAGAVAERTRLDDVGVVQLGDDILVHGDVHRNR
jgi:diaminohydroxyphosphoribosylaminopyrimidine deaminase/5-amino-6-(5-phosphoribosylamino)uracil reductase